MAKHTSDRVAVVTGGGQGIGRATVKHLLESGWRVALAEVDAEAGEEAAAEYAGLGPVRFVPCDVADDFSVEAMIQATLKHFGRIDGLVNNAGVGIQGHRPLARLSLADWNAVIGTNLTGAFLTVKYAEPHLRKARGAVVNVASTRALMSEAGTEAYAASKGGVVALTHALAISLGPVVRVNCVSPGWIDVTKWKKKSARTPATITADDDAQHPAGRVGRPEDVAAMVEYLLSAKAEFITGANFVIDGGMTRKMIYV